MKRLIVLSVVLLLVMVGTARAATPGGITLTPAIEQLSLPPDGSTMRFTARLTNGTARTLTLGLEAEDFTYLNQNGAIRFVDPGTTPGPHGLAAHLVFDQDVIHVYPGQTVAIGVTVTNPAALAAGGHYAAIVYHEVGPSSGRGATVGVQPAVASLLFVTAGRGGTVALKLEAPTVDRLVTSLPERTDLVFANTGNTQTSVHGVVEVLAPDGVPMSKGIINVDSGLILPGARRLFQVDMKPQTNQPRWPGLYTVQILYRHDGQAAYSRYTQRLLYVDAKLLIAIGLVVLAAAAIAFRRFGPARRL